MPPTTLNSEEPYKSLLTRNDEFDFSVLRFEEIKE